MDGKAYYVVVTNVAFNIVAFGTSNDRANEHVGHSSAGGGSLANLVSAVSK